MKQTILVMLLCFLLFFVGCTYQPEQPTKINVTNITNVTVSKPSLPSYQVIPRPNNLTFYFLSVEGEATLITTPNNKMVLIGAGLTGREIYLLLKNLGTNKLDYLILTHNRLEHVGGSPYLIIKTRPDKVFTNGLIRQESTVYDDYELAIQGFVEESISVDSSFEFDGVKFDLVVPYDDGQGFSTVVGDNSVVVKVTYGLLRVLLMEGCGGDCEDRILDSDLSANVIKLGSPESCDSNSLLFLKQVLADEAIIRGGVCQEVIDRLDFIQTKFYDVEGGVMITSDGVDYVISVEEE